MAKFKRFVDFFVTIEGEEGGELPEGAKSSDPEEAAKAAVEFVEDGHEDFGNHPQGKRVGDVQNRRSGKKISEELSASDQAFLAEMERELGGSSSPPQQPPSRPSDSGAPRTSLYDFNPMREGELAYDDFDTIYAGSGLSPSTSDDFNIYTVEQLLGSEHLAGQPPEIKRASLLVAMQARDVAVDDIISDAFERDQAIDAHDDALRHSLESIQQETSDKNAELQAEMERLLEELRASIESNNEKFARAQSSYEEWRELKRQEEERLFEAIAPFVSQHDNPVTVDD